jgi:hypothetical protein
MSRKLRLIDQSCNKPWHICLDRTLPQACPSRLTPSIGQQPAAQLPFTAQLLSKPPKLLTAHANSVALEGREYATPECSRPSNTWTDDGAARHIRIGQQPVDRLGDRHLALLTCRTDLTQRDASATCPSCDMVFQGRPACGMVFRIDAAWFLRLRPTEICRQTGGELLTRL